MKTQSLLRRSRLLSSALTVFDKEHSCAFSFLLSENHFELTNIRWPTQSNRWELRCCPVRANLSPFLLMTLSCHPT